MTKLFTAYVKQLLAEAGASKANWKAKDAAMYLVTALAVRGKTAGEGATATNQLFDVADFFQGQVNRPNRLLYLLWQQLNYKGKHSCKRVCYSGISTAISHRAHGFKF